MFPPVIRRTGTSGGVRLAEIGDLAHRTPSGAYHLLSCRIRGLVTRGRSEGGYGRVLCTDGNIDAERDFRRRRSIEMMKT
jgi:hypothetical protein